MAMVVAATFDGTDDEDDDDTDDVVTTDPCVTRIAHSNSGQTKPQLRGVQSHNNATTGAGGVQAALHHMCVYMYI